MKSVVDCKSCCGCTACASICPKKAIKMVTKKDGFKYPKIDRKKCINCGLCKKACPILNKEKNKIVNKCIIE